MGGGTARRHGMGCSEVSVQWGPWSGGSGMAANDARVAAHMAKMGVGMIAPGAALHALDSTMRSVAEASFAVRGRVLHSSTFQLNLSHDSH